VRNQRGIIWKLDPAQEGKRWALVNAAVNLGGWGGGENLWISPLTEELLASQEEVWYMRSVRKMDCRTLAFGRSKSKSQNVQSGSYRNTVG
jgi:hypothetical protein